MSVDGTLGFGDLLIDPAQGSAGPVMAVLVVGDAIGDAAGLLRCWWPAMAESAPDCPVPPRRGAWSRHSRTTSGRNGMRAPEDERQPRRLQRDLVGFGDHAGISDHGDVGRAGERP